MSGQPTSRKCAFCDREIADPRIPCSDGTTADKRRLASTSDDDICKSELKKQGY
jgi:hypothetical protein